MGARTLAAVVGALAVAGCSQILGLIAPKPTADAAIDARTDGGIDAAAGDFAFQVTTVNPRVPQGGFDFLTVAITRNDFTDPIDVDIPSPPAGVTVTPVTISGSATTGSLTLTGSAALTVGDMLQLNVVATGGDRTHDVPVTASVTLKPGILDPGFGGAGGIATLSGVPEAQFLDVAIAPDGDITAVGLAFSGGTQFGLIARFTGSGVVDPSFASGPLFGSDGIFMSVTRQSNGDVIAGGGGFDPSIGAAAPLLNSFDVNGNLVTSFSSLDNTNGNDFIDGAHGTNLGSNVTGFQVSSVIARPNDELMVLLVTGSASELVLQSSDGVSGQDPAFNNGNGSGVPIVIENPALPASMAFDTSTELTTYAMGFVDNIFSGAAAHVLADGSLDPAFGSGGVVVLPLTARAMAVQADNKLVIAGDVQSGGAAAGAVVARLLADGSLDPGFGSGGIVDLAGPFDDATFGTMDAVVIQTDGKIVAVGDGDTSSIVVRLLSDGSLDPTYGTAGVTLLDANLVSFGNLRLQSNGDALLCGGQSNGPAIVRLTP